MLVVVGGAATALAILLIGQAADFTEVARRLREAAPLWLVVCALGETVAYAGYLVAYRAMAALAGGPRLPAPVAIRVVALAFGAFSLATAVGGLSVDFWALREAGEPPPRASARVIAFETLRWAVVAVVTCLAAIASLTGVSRRVPWPVPVAWLVVVPACFAGGLWVSAPGRRERLTRPAAGAPAGRSASRSTRSCSCACSWRAAPSAAVWRGDAASAGARSAARSSTGPGTCCAPTRRFARSAPWSGSRRCCSDTRPGTCPKPCRSRPVAQAASMRR